MKSFDNLKYIILLFLNLNNFFQSFSQYNNELDSFLSVNYFPNIPDDTNKVLLYYKCALLYSEFERHDIEPYLSEFRWLEGFRLSNRLNYQKGTNMLMKIFDTIFNQKAFEPFINPLPEVDFVTEKKFKDFHRFRSEIHGGSIAKYNWLINDSIAFGCKKYLHFFKFYKGLMYFDWNNYDYAQKFFSDAIYNAKFEKDTSTLSMIYLYLGIVKWENDNLDSAALFFSKSYNLGLKISDSIKIAASLNNLGQIYFKQKRFKMALNSFDKAFKIYPKSKVNTDKLMLLINSAKALIFLSRYSRADEILNLAQESSNDSKNFEVFKYVYFYKGLLNEKQGLFENAIVWYKLFNNLKDSLLINEIENFYAIKNTELQDKLGANISEKNIESGKNLKTNISLNRSRLIIWSLGVGALLILFFILLLFRSLKAVKKSKQYLNELNKTKSNFLRIISHDLRSPLSGFINIISPLQRRIEQMPREDLIRYMSEMEEHAKNCYLLLNNLLIWSKNQRNHQEIYKEKFKLNEVIDLNINLYRSVANKKNIVLKSIIQENLEVIADKNMVELVVRNLIDNALKNSFENGEIIIKTNNCNNHTEISISDTGKGLTQEEINGLNGLNNNFSGEGIKPGLGLRLCKEFIEKHGGILDITSKGSGKGSNFMFTLIKNESNQNYYC